MSDAQQRARIIFEEAVEFSPLGKREQFVFARCSDDTKLRAEVEALLKAHDEAIDQETGLFQSGGDGQDDFRFDVASQGEATLAPDNSSLEKEGQILAGKYKLRQNIGEGGMGSVWVAEQLQPVKRNVAIKLVKAGMDSKQVLARFEAERQALAVMDHPNIAKVFDGGMTDQGRPFFVMEYVKGIPFTEYCDRACSATTIPPL